MTRRLTGAALAAALALTVTACGATTPTASNTASSTGSTSSAAASTASSSANSPASGGASEGCSADTPTSTGPVNLTDSFGRTVTLAAPAKRVAVLEWQQIEGVLSLCVTPVAVADNEGYTTWDVAETLPAGVVDVGTRGEPNLDVLFGTNPDLIIIEAYTATDEIIGQMEKYGVPVLATKGADVADPVENMVTTFNLIASAVGREDRATTVVDEFRGHLAEAKQTVAAAAPASKDFVYFDGYVQGGNVAIRPFGQGSLVGELGEALGLRNAWTGTVDEAYGLGQTDIEGMTAVGDASLFYTSTLDPSSDFVPELTKNPIWAALPAVAEGRTYPFPTGVWTFGGPRSAEKIVDAYVAALTG